MLCVLAVQAKSLAATNIALTPVSDTFISTHFTTPNGATPDMVIGTQGVMASSAQNRGLLKFDLSSIPVGSQVNSARLELTVRKSPPTPGNACDLHRLLQEFSEASSTWQMRTELDPWGAPGGQAGVDYVSAVSGTAPIGSVAGVTHTFDSTAGMIADVTRWITNASENHGWLIKTTNETVSFTARRIWTREGVVPPKLTVEYTPPQSLRITSASLNSGQFCAGFQAKAGKSYVLERRSVIGTGDWMQVATLPPVGTDRQATLCDAGGQGNGFYRIGEL
jgi:hypothetical protein